MRNQNMLWHLDILKKNGIIKEHNVLRQSWALSNNEAFVRQQSEKVLTVNKMDASFRH